MIILIRLIKFPIILCVNLKILRKNNYFSSAAVSMSIIKKSFSSSLIIFATILMFLATVGAQDFEAKIKLTSAGIIGIEGNLGGEKQNSPNKNWSFAQKIGSAENLGNRISDFNLSDR